MIFGRTDLWISQSRAKFDEEADFEVRSAVARQKSHQIGQKQNFQPKIFAEQFLSVNKNWNAGNRLKCFLAKFGLDFNFHVDFNFNFHFLQIWCGFWGATAERTSKSDSSSNFALDRLIQRSVRPKNLGFGEILGSPKNFHPGCRCPFSLRN